MSDEERNQFLEAYTANEADANKHMSFANAVAGAYMLLIWIFYLTGFFKIHSDITRVLINVAFPISVLILFTPLLYVFIFKDKLKKKGYKNFIIFTFILAIAALNIILPKHTVIAWALCILMTNHYYNTKLGTGVFILVALLAIPCMYGSMFVGEFDANLILGNEVIKDGHSLYAEGPSARYELFRQLIDLGYNRYVECLLDYYLPRAFILFLVYFVSFALNKRTYKLLENQILVNSEQQKTKTELEVAKDIQLATLPSEIETSKDIEIVAELRAAKEVGGDFYDYFKIDDDHTAIVIGDISGKGVPAAMFMMKTITCFRNHIGPNKTSAEILKLMNATLFDHNNSQMFVTCFLAIINNNTGELKFANAGHNPPIIGSNKNYRFLRCKTGFVLGALENVPVVDETIYLKNGESIMLYTDGVTEARNPEGEFYGERRFLDLMNAREYTCLVETHHALKDDIEKFVNGADQSDDVTIITMKFHGDECFYVEKSFDGKMENIKDALNFVENFCDTYDLDKDFKGKLLVVADELYSNIVKYGYNNNGGEIFSRLLFNKDKNEFAMTIIDRAPAFNPLEVNNAPVEGEVDKVQIGGLGILIVKKIMTQYAYDRINNKNILVLKKKL